MTAKPRQKVVDGRGAAQRRGSPADRALERPPSRNRKRSSATLDRATLARLAAHERWSRVPDRNAATAAARAAADDRFVAEARRCHPGLSEEEVLKRARNLRSAHAIRAARARWNGKRARDTSKRPGRRL